MTEQEQNGTNQDVKRWTAKRKAALILDLIKGTTTVAQAARTYDLTPAEIEEWLEEGLRGMENNLRSRPKDVAEQYESQIKDLQADLEREGRKVSIKRICRILGLPRRSFYYKPRKRRIRLNPDKVQKVSDCIEKFPTYGYRRIALLLSENRKVIQRILQKKHWQVRKRPVGHRPRVKVVPSQAPERDIRWSTDLARVWCGRNQWCHLALVIDCGSRELLGWRLSSRGHAKTAEAALEEALINRFGHLGRTTKPIILRSDNGLVFTSKRYTNTVRSYGLTQEFITPYTPEQNGIVERFIKSLKEKCVWQHRFESLSQAQSVIASWIRHYNTERPHQALGYKPPVLLDKVQALSA